MTKKRLVGWIVMISLLIFLVAGCRDNYMNVSANSYVEDMDIGCLERAKNDEGKLYKPENMEMGAQPRGRCKVSGYGA